MLKVRANVFPLRQGLPHPQRALAAGGGIHAGLEGGGACQEEPEDSGCLCKGLLLGAPRHHNVSKDRPGGLLAAIPARRGAGAGGTLGRQPHVPSLGSEIHGAHQLQINRVLLGRIEDACRYQPRLVR